MKAQKGKSLTADFEQNTWTFEMSDDFTIRAGEFMLVPMEQYAQQQPSEQPQDVEAMALEDSDKYKSDKDSICFEAHKMLQSGSTPQRLVIEKGFDLGVQYANAHNSKGWVSYSWENKKSHPPKAGKYWIYRKGCNKQHSEQWNGSGWSSSNNDCTHWQPLPQPPKD